jgi:ankyrin repeat protein
MCLFVSAQARQDKVIEVARVLIDAKANVDTQVTLSLCENGDVAISYDNNFYLMARVITLNVLQDVDQISPLMFAAMAGMLDYVKVLVDKGADVNRKGRGG